MERKGIKEYNKLEKKIIGREREKQSIRDGTRKGKQNGEIVSSVWQHYIVLSLSPNFLPTVPLKETTKPLIPC